MLIENMSKIFKEHSDNEYCRHNLTEGLRQNKSVISNYLFRLKHDGLITVSSVKSCPTLKKRHNHYKWLRDKHARKQHKSAPCVKVVKKKELIKVFSEVSKFKCPHCDSDVYYALDE